MVMEALPSPQSVGREFVRQYYTLLNKAPTHLHRFYNQQSSFVHGGLDPTNRETSPVIGQKQIHQKIQQLNFRDCHAKITQVDSQATLGDGVVVQVTGELSSAGQPMRRFTQTFVLAAQSPKKYYVHNDIFRYQDVIITEDECEGDVRSEPEDDVRHNIVGEVQQQQQQMYYQQHVAPPPMNGVHPEDLMMAQQPATAAAAAQMQQQVSPVPVVVEQRPPVVQQQQQEVDVEEEDPVDQGYGGEGVEPEEEAQQVVPQQVVQPVVVVQASSEPKTWANLLKSPAESSKQEYVAAVPSMVTLQQQQQQPAVQQPQRVPSPVGDSKNYSNSWAPRSGPPQQGKPPRQEGNRPGAPPRNSFNNDDGGDRRKPPGGGFPGNDVNQLFMGKLPPAATEDDLRDIFGEFGNVVLLRVFNKMANNNKMGNGGPAAGRATFNYGFITFDSQESVQACLAARPIFFPKGDKNGYNLNVEEKKTVGGGKPGYGRPEGGPRGGPRDNNGGPRRPLGGSGGPIGGGPNRGNVPPNNGPNNNRNSYNNRGPPRGGPQQQQPQQQQQQQTAGYNRR